MAQYSQATRLGRVEQAMITQMITEALARARSGPRASFAATLLRWLPTDALHPDRVWCDLDQLRDDELVLLAEEPA
jgi:hypothetical protein